jgi:hypothetical protein
MMRLPASRVPDPALAPPLSWGILGTGWIAADEIRRQIGIAFPWTGIVSRGTAS